MHIYTDIYIHMYPESRSATFPTLHTLADKVVKEYTPQYLPKTYLPLLYLRIKSPFHHYVFFSQRSCFKGSVPTTFKLLTARFKESTGWHYIPLVKVHNLVSCFQKTRIENTLYHQQRLKS